MDALLEFDWDEDKAALNVVSHGVAFSFAAAVFLDPERADIDASREADGEERRKAIGRIGRKLFVVVYTLRDGVHRIISARRTNRRGSHLWGLLGSPSTRLTRPGWLRTTKPALRP